MDNIRSRRHAGKRKLWSNFIIVALLFALLWSCNDKPTKPAYQSPPDGPVAVSSAWSPDGRRIAYSRSGYLAANIPTKTRIVDVATCQEVTIDSTGLAIGHMDWSPDGEWLALEIRRKIYKIPASGGSLIQLTEGAGWHFYPNWNSDGSLILYEAFTGQDTLGLHTITADGLLNRPLNILARWGDWLRDTDSVVAAFTLPTFCRRIGIAAGSESPQYWSTCNSGSLNGVAASPDGRYVAFAELLVVDSSNVGRQVHLLRRGDSVSTPISPVFCDQPSWSPDSKQIVYTSFVDGSLHLYDIVTGQTRRITDVIRPWPTE